jgi:hypothetical protein
MRVLDESGMVENLDALGSEIFPQGLDGRRPGGAVEIVRLGEAVELHVVAHAHLLDIPGRQEAREIADEVAHLDVIAFERLGHQPGGIVRLGQEGLVALDRRLAEQALVGDQHRMRAALGEQLFDQLPDLLYLLLSVPLALEVRKHDADIVLLALLARHRGIEEARLQHALPIVIEHVLETGGAGLGGSAMENDLAGHFLSCGMMCQASGIRLEDWHLHPAHVKVKAVPHALRHQARAAALSNRARFA